MKLIKSRPLRLIFTVSLYVIILSCIVPVDAREVTVDDSFSTEHLGRYIEYFIDTNGESDISQISSPGFSSQFKPCNTDKPSVGYIESPLWLKITINNRVNSAEHLVLEYDYPLIDEVVLFMPRKDGFSQIVTGDMYPAENRPLNYRTIAFPITINPGKQVYFIRVRTRGSMILALNLYKASAFEKKKYQEMMLFSFFYGIAAMLIVFNILILLSMRDISFFYLALFTISISVFSAIHTGLAPIYLWPASTWWSNISHPFFLTVTIIYSVLFSRSYLETSKHFPRIASCFTILMYAGIVLLISPFVFSYFIATQLSVLYAMITMISLLWLGLSMLSRGYREGIFYCIAWSSILIGGVLSTFLAFGIIPASLITSWGYLIGTTFLIVILSIGIVDKIFAYRRERIRALETLKESEEKYKILVDNAHDGIMLIINEMPVYANKSLLGMTGYSEAEFFKHHFLDFFPDTPKGRNMVYAFYKNRMNGIAAPSTYEAHMVTADSIVIDVMISAASATINGEKGSIAILTDITDKNRSQEVILEQFRKIQSQYNELEKLNNELITAHNKLIKANKKSNREKEQLLTTLSSIGDAVISYNADEEIQLMNKNAEKLTGWTIKEAQKQKVSAIIKLTDERASELIFHTYPQAYNPEGLDTIGIPFVLKDRHDNEKIVEINGSHIRNENETSGGVVLAIRDISDRVKLEKEILNMSKMESLGVLAGGIAHDFNNLLTAIMGNTSLAKNTVTQSPDLLEILNKIEHAANRAMNLTHQLLTFSKGGEPVKKTVYITDVIHESANLILSGSNIKLEFDFDEHSWPVDIDIGQLNQVLNNMLINAMQSMTVGGVLTIKTRNCDYVPEKIPIPSGRYVSIAIIDHGIGIPRENINRIFDPYFTTKKQGTGLGLASSYSIIKKHDGYIDVQSQIGKGTIFTIYLKASHKQVISRKDTSKERVHQSGKILVMDDEDLILDVTVNRLTALGYTVETAKDGEKAVHRYSAAIQSGDPYDAVIMDLTIPGGMGGEETIEAIIEIDPDVRAIVSSGYSDNPIMSSYEQHGFKGVLLKPYKMHDLGSVLEELLARN